MITLKQFWYGTLTKKATDLSYVDFIYCNDYLANPARYRHLVCNIFPIWVFGVFVLKSYSKQYTCEFTMNYNRNLIINSKICVTAKARYLCA